MVDFACSYPRCRHVHTLAAFAVSCFLFCSLSDHEPKPKPKPETRGRACTKCKGTSLANSSPNCPHCICDPHTPDFVTMPEQTSTYTFADLSGAAATSQDVNPYNALIHACANDAVQLSLHCHFALFIITRTSSKKREHDANIIWSQQTLTAAYETHRTTRAAQQRALLLSPSFPGPTIDTILSRLTSHDPDFHDTRYCLVFWARPTERVKKLAYELQGRVRDVLPCV